MNPKTLLLRNGYDSELQTLGEIEICLWYEGNPELLENLPACGLSIIGTREPRSRSLEFVDRLVKGLAIEPKVVISGFARGIDQRAHEAAIRFGLPTIAILGTGIDQNYPAHSVELKKEILKNGGLLLSEFPPGTEAWPSNFLQRNRLIALLSSAVAVIEAPNRSGTLNTANWAIKLSRALYAVPCSPGDPDFEGNEKLISDQTAIPLWGIHSLGATWIHYGAQFSIRSIEKYPEDEKNLILESRRMKAEWGECAQQSLYSRFLDQGWTPERFYHAWEGCVQSGKFIQKGGMVFEELPK